MESCRLSDPRRDPALSPAPPAPAAAAVAAAFRSEDATCEWSDRQEVNSIALLKSQQTFQQSFIVVWDTL